MQSTRARIVEMLRTGVSSVDDITNELGLASGTVRRHLDVLLRDGLVEMRSERLRLGRPHFLFKLSQAGVQAVPGHQVQFAASVLESLLSLTPDETRECSGSDVAVWVFDRLAERLICRCLPKVTAPELHERLIQTLKALSACGLDFAASVEDGCYVIRGAGCPCRRLLSSAADCEHDRRVLSELLGSALERAEYREGSGTYIVKPDVNGVLSQREREIY